MIVFLSPPLFHLALDLISFFQFPDITLRAILRHSWSEWSNTAPSKIFQINISHIRSPKHSHTTPFYQLCLVQTGYGYYQWTTYRTFDVHKQCTPPRLSDSALHFVIISVLSLEASPAFAFRNSKKLCQILNLRFILKDTL